MLVHSLDAETVHVSRVLNPMEHWPASHYATVPRWEYDEKHTGTGDSIGYYDDFWQADNYDHDRWGNGHGEGY